MKRFKPGQKVPMSGLYKVLERKVKGGRLHDTGLEVVATKGEPFAPGRGTALATMYEMATRADHHEGKGR